MVESAQFLFGKVMHKRIFPKVNQFTYGIYYIAVPVDDIQIMQNGFLFGVNKPGLLSFYSKDHGDRRGSDLGNWVRDILKKHDIQQANGGITLLTMPRVLGYVFNPVSFWLCRDKADRLIAVICEVNNTFGETHSYLCVKNDGSALEKEDEIEARKLFHVSPFLKREGSYKFRFSCTKQGFGAWIDFYDHSKNKQLLTLLSGQFEDFSKTSIKKAFWGFPLVTLKAIVLIHLQAVRLLFKGIRYVPKPDQLSDKTSSTKDYNE